MLYSPSRSSSVIVSFVLSILVVVTQAAPIDVPGGLNNVTPINTSNPLQSLDPGHLSFVKRAVGATHSSGAIGAERRLAPVRRAVGGVPDPAPTAVEHFSVLEKRSDSPSTTVVQSIDLPPETTGAPVDEYKVGLLHLVKRAPRPPRRTQKPAPAPVPNSNRLQLFLPRRPPPIFIFTKLSPKNTLLSLNIIDFCFPVLCNLPP
ncbi:hypothetical protein PCANC_06193 [Puccinia coronata f. sp. avenae]|uniref:Uncharacterized protein n=1 Tax=Puccinia coronata f. sp. avenae TaxID=200324 RepID=A0A2N5VTK4_9BASI|nr:hypothetical protein PCANC_06193 [Puccinia coronata f. sp. avenae]